MGIRLTFEVDGVDNIGVAGARLEWWFDNEPEAQVLEMDGNGPYSYVLAMPKGHTGTLHYTLSVYDVAGNVVIRV